jgi:hypothetical protein
MGERTGSDLPFLTQGQQVRPFVFGACDDVSLGHQPLPFLAKDTTGRTSYQNRCGRLLDLPV